MQTNESIRLRIKRTLHIRRAIALVWQSAPGWTIASVALLAAQSILPLLLLYLTKLVVDAVAAAMSTHDGVAVFKRVAVLIGLTGLVALAEALCRSITGFISEAQSQAVTDHVHNILHSKSIEVDLEYYENPQYYDALHRAQQQAFSRPTRIVNSLIKAGQSGIVLLAIAGLLVSFNWIIALILFIAVVPGILVRLRYSDKMYRWQRQQTPAERKALYLNWLLTGNQHAKEIRLFNLGPLFINRFNNLRKRLRREKLQISARRSAAELISQAIATFTIFGSYTFIAYQTILGIITLGGMVMYYQAFRRGQGCLHEMLSGMAGIYEDNIFLSNFYEFLDLKQKVAEPAHPRPFPQPIQAGIIFDHLIFQYPTGTKKVLTDINMTIRPGEHIALVGENGAGKTTLVKLLCRLYDPLAGRITVDGIDLRQFSTVALRGEISAIFQDYAKYNMPVRENIWFGNTDRPLDDDRILLAAQLSGADDMIAGLPHGYRTILGKLFDNGVELSVGEWQKVALARAFLRKAQILILDEPTSALDVKTEYEVFRRFHQLAKGRTVFLISHRLSTVRMANRIFILKDGKTAESGTHDELVRRNGTYASLFEMQAQHYR